MVPAARRRTPATRLPAIDHARPGRTARHPSQALRDLLGAVDGERCRYPSCTRRRKLHAHHLIAWLKGGRTDLANLVLLCTRHHETVVHGEGVHLDPTGSIDADTLPPDGVDTLHLHYAVEILMQQAA